MTYTLRITEADNGWYVEADSYAHEEQEEGGTSFTRVANNQDELQLIITEFTNGVFAGEED